MPAILEWRGSDPLMVTGQRSSRSNALMDRIHLWGTCASSRLAVTAGRVAAIVNPAQALIATLSIRSPLSQIAKLGKVEAQKQVSSADSWSFAEFVSRGSGGRTPFLANLKFLNILNTF